MIQSEYTPEEIAINGNGMYGGKRHDEICDYLQSTYNFNETQINDISMGVWKGIESERQISESKIKQLEAEIERLKKMTGSSWGICNNCGHRDE